MNSSIISVSDILNNAKNLSCTKFSQGYNFNAEKASLYFDDLINNTVSPDAIFSGILIFEKNNNGYVIIDGIQRITTICLLLCALCEFYKGTSEKNEDARKKVLERFLLSPIKENEAKLKLKKAENDIYKKIVFSDELFDEEKSSNIYETFQVFLKKLNEQKISGTVLFRVISKIQFMIVVTDKSEISARDLYQVINQDKGQSQVSLISDFIMQQDSEVYKMWNQIEKSFNESEYLLEAFLTDFLITREDNSMANKYALYNNFKNYFYKISKYQNPKEIIENILKYSQYYSKILNADFDNQVIKEQIELLNQNEGKDTYPYLMEVLDDLENSHIDIEAFINILMMINLFIKNRQEISISNVNIDFSSLSKELNKMLVLKDYVPEIFSENKLTINEINNLANFEV